MRRLAALVILLLAAAAPTLARGQVAAAADCNPIPDLIFRAIEPVLRQVAPSAGRLHFVKNGSDRPGCPGAGPACAAGAFVVAGDPVIVTGTTDDYACATFTGPASTVAATSGFLPQSALAAASPSMASAAGDWFGDWRSGPEQRIAITHAPDGRMVLTGDASFGATDPDRVKRGAVNTGDFVARVAPAGGQLAFLVGDDGRPLAYDSKRAKDDILCGLRLWRRGPYLVVADNLQCGGNNVTFTGVYRRTGKAS